MFALASARPLAVIAATISLSLCLAATAQTLPETRIVEVPGNASRAPSIDLPARAHYMHPDDFKPFAGTYELSNGDTLSLRRSGGAMYAQIGDGQEHRIIASSSNSFVALNRNLKVRIDHHSDGSVGGEVVMLVPPKQLADGTRTAESIASLGMPAR
ncbi:hypothetical protein [Janthinobacterium sp. RB2R34]|uniref:hypothetical protein n=1 Tax=Janthinobacterium sp. RB2R34 TaxID=3424193 RepID=UPI003F1EDB81